MQVASSVELTQRIVVPRIVYSKLKRQQKLFLGPTFERVNSFRFLRMPVPPVVLFVKGDRSSEGSMWCGRT